MAAKKPEPVDNSSSIAAIAGGGVAIASLIGYAVVWVPLGAVLFVAALAAGLLLPAPVVSEDDEDASPSRTGTALRQAARLWLPWGGTSAFWRCSPAGDCTLQEAAEKRFEQPWTQGAVVAALMSVAFAGLELAVIAALRDAPITVEVASLTGWVDVTSKPYWLSAVTPIFIWRLVRGYGWALRGSDALPSDSEGTLEQAPEIVLEDSLKATVKRLAECSLLISIPTLVVVAALTAVSAVFAPGNPIFVAIGTGITLAGWGVLLLGYIVFHGDVSSQRAEWSEWVHEKRQWPLRWLQLSGVKAEQDAPVLQPEVVEYPSAEKPMLRQLRFQLQPGTDFSTVEGQISKMKVMLGKNLCLIERELDEDTQAATWGTFLLTCENDDLFDVPHTPHLHPSLPAPVLWKCAAAAINEAFVALKLPTPIVQHAEEITSWPSSLLVEAVLVLQGTTTFSTLAKMHSKLAEKLSCDWLRLVEVKESEGRVGGAASLRLFYGVQGPSEMPQPVRYTEGRIVGGRRVDRTQEMAQIDWEYWMRACGLTGPTGTVPEFVQTRTVQGGLIQNTFALPDGMDHISVHESANKLTQTSKYGYLHVSEGPEAGLFTLTVGQKDPLDDVYLYRDYLPQIMKTPKRGEPDPNWAVGVTYDGSLLWYEWESGETPHLLIAGSTGGGKSQIVNSMLAQMLCNNDPADVQFWMLEPKNELQVFQHFPHVRRFIDNNVTSMKNAFEPAAVLMEEAREEMDARYMAFARHPRNPKKLSEARGLAKRDPEGSGHLMFPYLFIIVEECSNYFKKPTHPKEAVEGWQRLTIAYEELARKARASGIFLAAITQYPTKDNIPQTAKQQMSRLGLRVTSQVASMVVIDQPGLEKLKQPGRGLLTGRKDLEAFRGFFMDAPDSDRPDIPDDMADAIAGVPLNHDEWPKLPAGVPVSEFVAIECGLDIKHDEEGNILPLREPTVGPYQPPDEEAATDDVEEEQVRHARPEWFPEPERIVPEPRAPRPSDAHYLPDVSQEQPEPAPTADEDTETLNMDTEDEDLFPIEYDEEYLDYEPDSATLDELFSSMAGDPEN